MSHVNGEYMGECHAKDWFEHRRASQQAMEQVNDMHMAVSQLAGNSEALKVLPEMVQEIKELRKDVKSSIPLRLVLLVVLFWGVFQLVETIKGSDVEVRIDHTGIHISHGNKGEKNEPKPSVAAPTQTDSHPR